MEKTSYHALFTIVLCLFMSLYSTASGRENTKKKPQVIADLHSDVVLWVEAGKVKFSKKNSVGQTDLPRLIEGGVNVATFNLWADPLYLERRTSWPRTIYMIEIWRELLRRNHDAIEAVTDAGKLKSVLANGKIAAIGKLEGAHSLEGDLKRLDDLQRSGISILQITWNNTNEFGDSCNGVVKHHGLSKLGYKLVKELNRRGMVVDLAHASEDTTIAAAKASAYPIIISHTAVKALKDHNRTVSDAVIKAIASKGGLVCISAVNDFLSESWGEGIKKFRENYAKDIKKINELYVDWVANAIVMNDFYEKKNFRKWAKPASIDNLIDHIQYVTKLVGVDFVGIGTDFDGWEAFNFPSDLKDYSMFKNIRTKLEERGFSEGDVKKIMGGNFLRVFTKVTKKNG